ncbi:MAG: glycoside hydrolase family 38 C-terminal domain-containing protein [Lentisphaeria bacterium]
MSFSLTGLLQQVKSVNEQAESAVREELERFQYQMEFAQFLCEQRPRDAVRWQPALTAAAGRLAQAAGGSAATVRRAVRDAEKDLAALATAARGYTVHLVGHAHIDMNWMWSWPETVAITNDTLGTVLRLMEEFPEFHFSQSQASVYAILEQYHPELLRQVAARVREGRWEVTASHWVEGDKNLAGPESLCRHLQYTRAYLQELFGLAPEAVQVDWAPDTFGHPATEPTYLVRGGVKYLYLHRPGAHGAKRPEAFRWRGPDGSSVLVRNDMRYGYNGIIQPETLLYQLRTSIVENHIPETMFVFGIGDHGGGPTRRDLRLMRRLMEWPVFPKLLPSTAHRFFARLEQAADRLPVLDGELNFELAGCYTTQSLIKRANRLGENRLVDAEAAAVLGRRVLGREVPHEALRTGWRDTLFNHFHDILPGSGVHDTRTYTHGLFQKTAAATSMIETLTYRAVAAEVDTLAGAPAPAGAAAVPAVFDYGLGAGVGYGGAEGALSQMEGGAGHGVRPFVLFNPLPWERTEVVEATLWDQAETLRTVPLQERLYAAVAPDGAKVPAQIINSGEYWGHLFVTVTFPVRVPAGGYAVYSVLEEPLATPRRMGGSMGNQPVLMDAAGVPVPPPAETPAAVRQLARRHHCFYIAHEREPQGLENEFLRLELNPLTGGIARLLDKRRGRWSVLAGSAPLLEYAVERPHSMTAWIIEHTGPAEAPRLTGLGPKQAGPHKASVEAKYVIHESDFTVTYELRAGDPALYLRIEGTWFQRGTPATGIPTLRLALPLNLDGAAGRYEIPFGSIDRDLNAGQEVPALQWAQVNGRADGKGAGCLLLNDGKHGHALDGNTLYLTLIRASYDPDPLPEIGRHDVRLALLPFRGTLEPADAARLARNFNHPLRVVGTTVHPGSLPAAAAGVTLRTPGVVLAAVRPAQAGDGVVLELYSARDTEVTAEMTVGSLLGRVRTARETDLLERPLARGTAAAKGGTVTVTVPARGIAVVLLQFR